MAGRRQVLKALVGGAAGLASPAWVASTMAGAISLAPRLAPARERAPGDKASRDVARAAPPAVQRLTDNLVLITGAGGNVVALTGPDGTLLVDTGTPERTRELLKTVAMLPGGRHVPVAFNTHWHWDHTGGNEALRRSGTKLIAHENTRLWLGEPIWVEWQNRRYPPRPKEAWPTETFWTGGQMTFAGEPIEYGHLGQAHTDGDLYVHFKRSNVLAAGCVLSVGRYPILDYSTGGWIGGMAEATQRLLAITDEKTRIIPGIGPVATRADLAAEHEMLAALQEDLWQLMRKGYGAEDMIASGVSQKFDEKWGTPDLFIRQAYQGLYAHVREMRGVV